MIAWLYEKLKVLKLHELVLPITVILLVNQCGLAWVMQMAGLDTITKGSDTWSEKGAVWNKHTVEALWGFIMNSHYFTWLQASPTWWFCVAACRLYTNSSWYCGSKVSITVSPLSTNRRPLDRGALSGSQTHGVVHMLVVLWTHQ